MFPLNQLRTSQDWEAKDTTRSRPRQKSGRTRGSKEVLWNPNCKKGASHQHYHYEEWKRPTKADLDDPE